MSVPSDSSFNDKNDIEQGVPSKFPSDEILEPHHRPMAVSGWDDDDEGIEEELHPHETPEKEILWAAENGNKEIVEKLLKVNRTLTGIRDKDGYTPLHRACYGNHHEVAKVLLVHGANASALTNEKWTPLHSACQWCATHCIDLLVRHGVDVNSQTQGGITPLHLAATNRASRDCFKILLSHPLIDVTLKNKSDETAYDIALRHGLNSDLFEVTEKCFNYV